MTTSNLLKFSHNNSKLHELAKMLGMKKTNVVSFDLPAGFTCPMASLCQAYSNKQTGKITRGKNAQFLCYAAKLEAVFTAVRKAHWYNFEAIKGLDKTDMVSLILASLPKNAKVVRIHSSGDFYSSDYFEAWKLVATYRSDIVFFGYTKIFDYAVSDLPSNMHLAYSYGGKNDGKRDIAAAANVNVCTSFVVPTAAAAAAAGLTVACVTPISPDDYNFILRGESFALIIH